METNAEKRRAFAEQVVERLRGAGFTAYWAGGCVRDQLLGRTPKDYDVATDATPPQIRDLFGRRRTLAIGAAFGVITVLGPKQAGQVEVTTFRRETTYSDGRHPDSVSFSSAQEDASRRDFTINGMFFDPVEGRVIDFVGGQEDLRRGMIRAIGDPEERIAEDKLRMLRAIRFASAFDFELDPKTYEAIRRRAAEIGVVSVERIAEEMRKMLTGDGRSRAVRLILETGLAGAILPEIVPSGPGEQQQVERSLAVLKLLENPGFPLALAALLIGRVESGESEEICRRWRLSNRELDRVRWLVVHHGATANASQKPWSEIQPILVAEGAEDLLALGEAEAKLGERAAGEIAWCREQRMRPPEELDPPPILTGDDLKRHGLTPGPVFSVLLDRIRRAQLDQKIHTPGEALDFLDRLLEEQEIGNGQKGKKEG